MTLTARLGLRVLFGLVLLSLPVMVVVREQKGEFYPALYQPAFDALSMRGNLFEQRQPVISVRDTSGVRHRIELSELIDAPDVERSFVLGLARSALGNPYRIGTPAGLEFLRTRAVELGVEHPVTVQVTWYDLAMGPRDLATARRTATSATYTLDLRR